MAEVTWKKTNQTQRSASPQRWKFLATGAILIAAVVYLIVSGTASGAQYFMTVDELMREPDYVGQSVRISGAVVGDSIQYDTGSLILDFTIAHIPAETQNLALTLHEAVTNPATTRLKVHLENQVKPDLLQHEAQAIITGRLGEDGIFYANEVLLKCPSRYEENVPNQIEGGSGV